MSKARVVVWRNERADMLSKLEALGPKATLKNGWIDWCMTTGMISYQNYCKRIGRAKLER